MDEQAAGLERIREAIEAADITPELRQTATQLVFGSGPANAQLMFVGEAPGKNEDRTGEPFVGAAGNFLNQMLASIEMDRSQVYVTNIVKYRPPENRDPTPSEIAAFKPYLMQQIALIQPKIVIFLGRHAMNVFFPELKISEAHGQPMQRDGQWYLPLFHPAAALYNGGQRQTLLADFAAIPELLHKVASA